MSGVTYTYKAPTTDLRDWLRLQSIAVAFGGPSSTDARIFANDTGGLVPLGVSMPAVGFHVYPGTVYDNTLAHVPFQFDVHGTSWEQVEALAADLASFLASTPPNTRLSSALVFQGPAVIIDSFPLPVNIDRRSRQVLRARLTFAAF